MYNIYFTADTHFSHVKIIEYCNRPFKDVEEMNEVLINNWNRKVNNDSIVYHLGDVGLYEYEHVLKRLKGNIILIKGNHDKKLKSNVKQYFKEIVNSKILFLKDHGISITLNHLPLYIWQHMEFNSYHLHGHTHNILHREGKVMDVGVDTNNFELYSLEDILEIMNNKANNEIWIEKLAGYNKEEYNKYKVKYQETIRKGKNE